MKTYTEIKYQILPNGGLEFVSEKSFDYEGPVELCLRAEEGMAKDAAKTASTVGASLGQTAAGERSVLDPFYRREMATEHAYDPTQLDEMLTAAGAGIGSAAGAAENQMQQQAASTGNAAGIAKSEQQLARDRMKAAAGTSEGIAAQDVTGALGLRQAGAAGESGLYGENLKGQLDAMGQVSGDINAATNASKSGWLQNAEGIANTAANVASVCPAEGSLYLMADGSEKPVEELKTNESIMGIDDEPQEIEEIQSAFVDILRVTTENGFVSRSSLIHAFALPKGGFTVAVRSLGKTISTAKGPSKVTSVEYAGKAWVFNIITNGSHTYRADGIWALGVGDGERCVAANEWADINRRMLAEIKNLCWLCKKRERINEHTRKC